VRAPACPGDTPCTEDESETDETKQFCVKKKKKDDAWLTYVKYGLYGVASLLLLLLLFVFMRHGG
jgi:hypothetical protein